MNRYEVVVPSVNGTRREIVWADNYNANPVGLQFYTTSPGNGPYADDVTQTVKFYNARGGYLSVEQVDR